MKEQLGRKGLFLTLDNERGVALLVTVMVVSILIGITMHLGMTVRQEILSSTHGRERNTLQIMALSGLQWGLAALNTDMQGTYNSFNDNWYKIAEANVSSLFSGSLKVKVSDLSGRLQINSLDPSLNTSDESKEILLRLLGVDELGIEDPAIREEIVDSLIDWVDSNDDASFNGAEHSYYQSLSRPHQCKNGSIDSIDELLLVKGINRDLLMGTKETKGLADYITAHGVDGKINLNTADPLLLSALSVDIDTDKAQKMVEYRKDPSKSGELASVNWYKKVPTLAGLTLASEILTVKSVFFKVEAVAERNNKSSKAEMIVKRNQYNKIEILSKRVE